MDGSIAAADPRPCGAMHVQPVPNDEYRGAELAAEPAEEAKQGMGDDVFVREETKVKSHLAPSCRDGQCGDHRDALVGATALVKYGRPADRSPGASNERGHEEPALVEKDDGGPQSPGVFFTRGQSFRIHSRIASSSRSRARRSGFWGLNPSDRRRRPIWFA